MEQCISPGIQRMPPDHAQHLAHHHSTICNIGLARVPPFSSQAPCRQASPGAPYAPAPERTPAPVEQHPELGLAGGADRADGPGERTWERDWRGFPDPLGGKVLLAVMEVFGW